VVKLINSMIKNKLVHYVKFVPPILAISLQYLQAKSREWVSRELHEHELGPFNQQSLLQLKLIYFLFHRLIDSHSWKKLLSLNIFHLKLNHIKNF